MLFAVLMVGLLGGYLFVEERERSTANPNGTGWWLRVRMSARGKLWFVIGTLLGLGIQVARKKDPSDILALGAIAVFLLVFFTLHEATLSLPRKDQTPK